MAGSLVPKHGWFYGALTQLFKMLGLTLLIVLMIRLSAPVPEFSYLVRLSLFSMASAGIAGGVAQRYRVKIWSFLGTIFGFVAAGLGCLMHALSGLLYLYFLYLGGKALFEDGAFLRALLYWVIVGPLVSYAVGFLMMGIALLGAKIFEALHNWYAEDLGLEPIDWA